MSRTEKHAAAATFNAVWQDADRPPWEVRSNVIERRKIDLLEPYLAPVRSVIDCACGGGDFLDMLAERADARLGTVGGTSRFTRVVGLDIADNALVRARRTGRYHELHQTHLEDAPRCASGPFDLVIVGEVLQYLADYLAALGALADAFVAPGGLIFIAVAVGRKYLRARHVAAMRALLERRGYLRLEDRTLDYTWLGVPRRKLPFARAYFQTHKEVLLYRRGPGPA